jgi:hypothetical protein
MLGSRQTFIFLALNLGFSFFRLHNRISSLISNLRASLYPVPSIFLNILLHRTAAAPSAA